MYDPTATRGRPVRVPAGLILPVGPTGTGKTSLARRLVRHGLDPAGIIAADSLTPETVRQQVDIKLRAGMTVFVDAENLSRAARRELVTQAHGAGRSATALLAAERPFAELLDRGSLESVTAWQRISVSSLTGEGFDRVETFDDASDVIALPSGVDWRAVPGPFAVIADVHGCFDTLMDLLAQLGFDAELNHPDGLFPVFVGDLTDKGGRMAEDVDDPAGIGAVKVLRFVLAARAAGKAALIYGNHERKLARKLAYGDTPDGVGVGTTIAAIAAQSDAETLTATVIGTLPTLPTHLQLDDGASGLIAVHGGIKPELVGRNDRKAQNFCLYARDGWVEKWDRPETVVHGHVVQPAGPSVTRSPSGAEIVGIDTGAFEGGGLSAYRSDTRACATVPTRDAERASETLLARYRAEVEALLAAPA